MLANTEPTQDYSVLDRQFKMLVAALLEVVNIPPIPMEVATTHEGHFRGFDGGKFYLVKSGSLSVRYHGKTIYVMHPGDMLLPDITGSTDADVTVYYGSDTGAVVESYSALEFMGKVFSEPTAIKLWTRLLITYAGLMLRITASLSQQDAQATPGFEQYEPGELIIRQGERADYVFNLSTGVAEVLVDDVTVGRVGEGEIFGAMAALTHADRSATVRAKTHCAVVKVPKEQFTELIKSNPATIHSLLIDMANSIVNLNAQLVGLRGNDT